MVFDKSLSISRDYLKELGATYVAYSLSFVLMPVLAECFVLCAQQGDPSTSHRVAIKLASFWFALLVTGVLNLFTVSAVFKRSK